VTHEPPVFTTDRLRLEPLRVDDAAEMAAVLADPALYTFTGGEPPTEDELRRRYGFQVAGGPADGSERWLNWIVRSRAEGVAVGYVQATLGQATRAGRGASADVAWVIGVAWQGHRYAAEAARAMVHWLIAPEPGGAGVAAVTAHIRPDHEASASVARSLGLEPTDEVEDGEIVWRVAASAARLAALARWASELEWLRGDGRAGTWAGGQTDADDVIHMPYVELSDRILAFVREMSGLGWVHPFDWPAWASSEAGRRLLEDPSRIADASADELGRLLTTIVRGDRFHEGMLLGAAETGALAAIARRAGALADDR
jgi:RimJ/RimL family protein N-acetyltransferase